VIVSLILNKNEKIKQHLKKIHKTNNTLQEKKTI